MSPQAGWLLQEAIVPCLRSAIPRAVRCIGSEDHEELIQDGTVLAARLLDNAEKAGKKVTPGNIAYYTILHLKSGRRSTGNSNADVLGSATQLNGRSSPVSFDEPVQEDELGENFTVSDVFASDLEDPSQIAARHLDWQTLMARLPVREKAIIVALVEGRTVSDVASGNSSSAATTGLSCRIREAGRKNDECRSENGETRRIFPAPNEKGR